MNIDQRLHVKNKHLDYLMFSGWSELQALFENISSWVGGSNDKQEAKFLLTEMVCSIFEVPFNVTFGYREHIVNKIKNKPGYEMIEQAMKTEIIRLYNATQERLKTEFKTNSILLYRGLNQNELDYFYKEPSKIKTNKLSSFTVDPIRYRTEVQVSVEIPIENVLFYENLCPFKELVEQDYAFSLGLHVEREVVVFNKEDFFDIKEVTFTNENAKRLREAEESF
ncbi:hypothetical protein CN887_21045 [Bacillus pseudomycoides]|uniref:hypothetical protein n=1 Tax=Bacillus pseudomycoides TaxID=64104 RepID=UPI000BEF297C|nr:hypothetical protein [Bacillus pseudomycoides]PEJ23201.1 hypothetical protein CN887_21045 [Bacillus pseudomycoides]